MKFDKITNDSKSNKWAGKIILGFVGPIASGKGTACQYLKDKYGATTYRFSTILRDILNRLYLNQSRENLQNISLILREQFGQDLLAAVIAKDVSNDQNQIVAVDGVRRQPDIKYLRELTGFYLVSIDADQKTRHQRIVQRGENSDDSKKTFSELQKDEQGETEINIKAVAKDADFKIDNNGTLEQLQQQIDEILKRIKN